MRQGIIFNLGLKKQNIDTKKKKKRHRNVTLFNPPFCKSVKTNIGREFLKIVSESFPKSHKLSKICNRSSIKINYCVLPNIGKKILAGSAKKHIRPKLDINPPCINHRNGNPRPCGRK